MITNKKSKLEKSMQLIQEHNYVGNKLFYRLALITGILNIVLFFVLMLLVFQNSLSIDTALKSVSSLFLFYIVFAFQSLNSIDK